VEIAMNVSEQDAKESLASISDTTSKTRRAVVEGYGSPFMVLWGAIWTVCYLVSHFFPRSGREIFTAGGIAGATGIVIFLVRQSRRGPAIRNPLDKSLELRTHLLWLVTFAYACAYLAVLRPSDGIRMNAFLGMVVMFVFVVMGLWFCSWIMAVLGIVITATTLVGCLAIHPMYYCLWMAVTFGGGMLGTGLYMYVKWR
jgi:hypothetical protein